MRSCNASSSFLIYVRCGPVNIALELPREFVLLRRGYAEVWQPYVEAHWTRLAPKESQSKAEFVRHVRLSAIWGACTRVMSPTGREIVILLTWNIAEQIMLERGIRPDAVSAYHLEIRWGPDGR